jgi:hypothetical protein
MHLLLAVLLSCDDTALAGAAYQEAEAALRDSKYDAAIRKAQEALRLEPKETDRLLYRDREGRQKIAYYPHYLWARARALQARDEKDLPTRVQELREAVTHLELSSHPSARELLESTKKDLALAEKAAAAPPEADAALAVAKTAIAELLDHDRFEDARDRMRKDQPLWDRFPADRDQAAAAVEFRRGAVVARAERALALALETAAEASPLEKPDLIPSILRPALLPPSVLRNPEGAFRWAREFLELYEKQLPALRNPAGASGAPEAAKAFEASAAAAVAIGSVPAYRTAARVADALRDRRLAELWPGAGDDAVESFLKESENTIRAREALLTKAGTPGIADLLVPSRDTLRQASRRLGERRELRKAAEAWLARAEGGLADRETMSSPGALRALAREAGGPERNARWGELPAELRARVLYARAVLDLVADALGGESPDSPAAETLARAREAKGLHPGVEGWWAERISPKIRHRLAEEGK